MNRPPHPASSDDDVPLVVKAIGGMAVLASLVASLVVTWVCFTGGTIPLLGIEVEGSFTLGLVAVLVIDPLIMLVGLWVAMLLAGAWTLLSDRIR